MDYSEERVRTKYVKLTERLIKSKLTITTMESATSGQIASLITDTEGASAIFKGADITYSNETKIAAGVSKETIEKYTVYSEETAREMADSCRKKYSADIGIGVTGNMGNVDPANPAASVPGRCYFAISIRKKIYTNVLSIPFLPTRLAYKLWVAESIVDTLNLLLDNLGE